MFEFIEQARLAARAFVEFSGHLFDPTIRLGVTGLSHAGKTVFITALVHGLVRSGRFPVFEALATGRVGAHTLHRSRTMRCRVLIMKAIYTRWWPSAAGQPRRDRSASCELSSNTNRRAGISASSLSISSTIRASGFSTYLS